MRLLLACLHALVLVLLFSSSQFVFSLSQNLSKNFDENGKIKALFLYNFGLVVHNDQFTIYRSSALGHRGIRNVRRHLKAIAMPLPKTIIYMNYRGYKFPTYFANKEFTSQNEFNFRFYHSFGLDHERTYVDGYNPYEPRKNIDKKRYLGRVARRLFPLRDHPEADGGLDAFKRVLELVLKPENQPVLFHCLGGKHRTGMLAMALRYLQGGTWLSGQKKTFRGLQLNPAQYEYSRYNRLLFREENILFVESFSQEDYFQELIEEYRPLLQEDSHSH